VLCLIVVPLPPGKNPFAVISGVAFKTQFPSPAEFNVNECLNMSTKSEHSQHAVGYLFLLTFHGTTGIHTFFQF
jgi:hypothetical protein